MLVTEMQFRRSFSYRANRELRHFHGMPDISASIGSICLADIFISLILAEGNKNYAWGVKMLLF